MSHYKSGRRSQTNSEEARTPIAWQHRDLNYHQQGYSDRYRTDHIRRGPASVSDHTSNTERSSRTKRLSREPPAAAYRGGRPPPDSETSSTASETSQDTQVPTHAGSRHGGPAMQLVAIPSGGGGPPTIRSAQSVPLLLSTGPAGAPLTWDGEPCPVHHPLAPLPPQMALSAGPLSLPPPLHAGAFSLPRAASMYDLRVTTPHPGYGPPGDPYHPAVMTIDRKSLLMPPPPMSMAGPGSTLGRGTLPPGALLPPMMRPRPIVRAEDGAPRELPVRDPRKPSLLPSPPSTMQKGGPSCGGLKRVLAISLAVIVLGVILAVALFFITK